MIDPKSVTIVIPHLGATEKQRYALDQCLISLYETVPDIKIIVVVNGVDTDNQSLWDHIPQKNIKLMLLQEQGQCKAVNAAVATTDTEWIFITNDDMVYPPGWFEKLTNFNSEMFLVNRKEISREDLEQKPGNLFSFNDSSLIQQLPSIMCISPMLVEPIKGAPTFKEYFCGGAGGDFNKEKFLEFAKNYQEGELRTGFNFPILIKKELLDVVSTYDIQYDPWGSNGDSDLQAKIHLAGIQPYQNTNAIVYHFSQTSGTSHPDHRPSWEVNWHYFIKKWGFERASSPDVWTSTNIIDYEKLKYHPWWENFYKNK